MSKVSARAATQAAAKRSLVTAGEAVLRERGLLLGQYDSLSDWASCMDRRVYPDNTYKELEEWALRLEGSEDSETDLIGVSQDYETLHDDIHDATQHLEVDTLDDVSLFYWVRSPTPFLVEAERYTPEHLGALTQECFQVVSGQAHPTFAEVREGLTKLKASREGGG